jgi:alanine racemase
MATPHQQPTILAESEARGQRKRRSPNPLAARKAQELVVHGALIAGWQDHEPTIAEISLDALRHNFRAIQKLVQPGTSILGIVKANAYGHGATLIGRALLEEGAKILGVGRLCEGIELREAGIKAPLLLLGGALPEAAGEILRWNLCPVVYDMEMVRALDRVAREWDRKVRVHLKVETGMARLGFPAGSVLGAVQEIVRLKTIRVEGILTHFASADGDEEFTAEQTRRFNEVLESLRAAGFQIPFTHAANSAGILRSPGIAHNMVRPGILLYGCLPTSRVEPQIELKPVLTWKSRVAQIRSLAMGETVGYGRTYKTYRDSRIAVLPVGYADGVNRALSNTGSVLIGGRRASIVGKVCMDLMMVDITDHQVVNVGDEAILLGRQGEAEIHATEIAEMLGTIPYEVFCAISSRVPRRVT